MNKKWLYITLFLMSVALIGIILVQGYWIKISFDSRSEEFSTAIIDVLEHTSEPEEIVEELVEKARHGAVIFGTFYDDPFDDFEHISYDLSGCREILENNKNPEWEITNVGSYWNDETTVYQILKPNEEWN